MILDPREGSKDYIEPLKVAGVPVEVEIMEFGDMALTGVGPEGKPVLVGVEAKKVSDLLTSIRDGRAATQLRGMTRAYEVRWLLIEGWMGPDHTGALSTQEHGRFVAARGGFTYAEVAGWLLTMSHTCGVLIKHSASHFESLLWLRSLWLWWCASEWESHRSHLALYQPPMPSTGFLEPPIRQQYAQLILPGLGPEKALRAADYFPSIEAMVQASAKDWQEIEGVGKKLAAKIVAAQR